MACEDIKRDVNPVFVEVTRDILPEICELKSGACEIRKSLPFDIPVSSQIEDKAADGISGIPAVAQDGFPARVPVDVLVLSKRGEEVGERLHRNVAGYDRFVQRYKDRMLRSPSVALLQLGFP